MHVDEQQILNLSQELWSSQLGLNLRPVSEPSELANEPTLSTRIKVSGDWSGAIVIECSESVARHAAAMLFAPDDESNEEEDLRDALNELADMVGRKVRGILPETTKLSRAAILKSDNGEQPLDNMQGLSRLELSCEGRAVRISLLEQEAAPAETVEV